MPAIEGYKHLARDETHKGGKPRVAEAGVTVYTIVGLYEGGMSPEEISAEYDSLSVGAVFSALAYAADHAEEVKAYFDEAERDEAEFRRNHPLDPKLKAALEHPPFLP